MPEKTEEKELSRFRVVSFHSEFAYADGIYENVPIARIESSLLRARGGR